MKYIYLILSVLVIANVISCNPKKSEATNRGPNNSVETGTGKIDTNNVSAPVVTTVKPLREIPANAPQFVRDAAESAPGGAFIGIGTAKLSSLSMSRSTAATHARADISRQINSTVERSEDGTATLTVSNAELTGAKIIEEDMDDEGNYWVVVMMIIE